MSKFLPTPGRESEGADDLSMMKVCRESVIRYGSKSMKDVEL